MSITVPRGAIVSKESVMFITRLLAGFAAFLSQCLEDYLGSSEYPNMYFQ